MRQESAFKFCSSRFSPDTNNCIANFQPELFENLAEPHSNPQDHESRENALYNLLCAKAPHMLQRSLELPEFTADERIRTKGKFPREILIGEAGGNLVISKLMARGIPAYPVTPGLAYDVVADLDALGLVRIQVKTTVSLQGKKYRFIMKRGFHRSLHGTFRYTKGDYDVAAFVCLPLGRVLYSAAPTRSFRISPTQFMADGLEERSWEMSIPRTHSFRNISKCRPRRLPSSAAFALNQRGFL